MKKHLLKTFISVILCVILLALSSINLVVFAQEEKSDEIVILFENDMHCAIDGYSKIAALKTELLESHSYVGVVSCGDFVQGDTLGAISQGEYIVDVMNLVGYDAIALGNHEFDYKLQRLSELTDMLTTKPVCSNFYKIGEDSSVFEPYVIKSYGDTDVAFVGITTPDTLTSSSPVQFMDTEGNYIYTFSGTELYSRVQSAVDSAKADGADYIIGLSHLGTEDVYEQWSVQTLIKNTTGFDAILDGHSHSVVENMTVNDKNSNTVIVSSTGTKFANLGMLTISETGVTTELISADSLTRTDPLIDARVSEIKEEYAVLGNRVIGKSEVELITHDNDGNRLIRTTQTNMGDFCSDAYRIVTGADVGVVNGGGIRSDLKAGDITFNDILSIHPYNNTVCVAEVTGQQIADFLEFTIASYPEENGSFQHISGITYTLHAYIPSSVAFDENMAFESIGNTRRVSDIKILNSKTGIYEPIDMSKIYTLASHNYLLLDHGSGATMLDNANIISNTGMLDVELIEVYIKEHLGSVIGKEYETAQNRIKVLTEPETETPPTTDTDHNDNSEKSPLTGSALPVDLCFILSLLLFFTLIHITNQNRKNKSTYTSKQ